MDFLYFGVSFAGVLKLFCFKDIFIYCCGNDIFKFLHTRARNTLYNS